MAIRTHSQEDQIQLREVAACTTNAGRSKKGCVVGPTQAVPSLSRGSPGGSDAMCFSVPTPRGIKSLTRNVAACRSTQRRLKIPFSVLAREGSPSAARIQKSLTLCAGLDPLLGETSSYKVLFVHQRQESLTMICPKSIVQQTAHTEY